MIHVKQIITKLQPQENIMPSGGMYSFLKKAQGLQISSEILMTTGTENQKPSITTLKFSNMESFAATVFHIMQMQ